MLVLGGEIFVLDGLYIENINVTKTVSVSGEDIDTVIIKNSQSGNIVTIQSPNVIIKNFTIVTNPSADGMVSAIYDDSFKSVFCNLKIYNASCGINLTPNSNDSIITDNYLINNTIGLIYSYSSGMSIYNNYFDNHRNCEIISDQEFIHYFNISKTESINIIGGNYLGGNYWSDYSGMDYNGDGLGEAPYVVDNSSYFLDSQPLTHNSNLAPTVGTPHPPNNSNNNPLNIDWSIQINDPETGLFNWNISCSNGQYSFSNNDSNGTKILQLNSLSYSTIYTVRVSATDSYRWTNESYTFKTKNKGNIYTNLKPVAIIDGFLIGFPEENIRLNANKSYDPDGSITSYIWNLDNGTSLEGKDIDLTYSKPGNYTVTLTVYDSQGASNTTRSDIIILKGNNPPELNFSVENTSEERTVNLTLTVFDKDNDDVNVTIEWGDNSSPPFIQLIDNQTIIKQHTYPSNGTFLVTVIASDGSTETSDAKNITVTTDKEKEKDEKKEDRNGNGSINWFEYILWNKDPFDEEFMGNQIDSRSIIGKPFDRNLSKIIATILSIILLFLLNFIVEFSSDYFSERTIEFRKTIKEKLLPNALKNLPKTSFLNLNEIFAIVASSIILSIVLTWAWTPDLSIFWEPLVIFLLITLFFIFIREALRAFLCKKFKFHSRYYVWPVGAIMMFVSTALGNTFSLAANHDYKEEDIKKCGKVSYIVSFIMFIIVAVTFIINLFYPSTILQMIIIVNILNLFIDLFPLNPMDGYEIRHWNRYLWLGLYIFVFIFYVVVYFNVYP